MTVLFILALFAWLAVFLYTVPAFVSIFFGRPRNFDPWRLACSAYAFLSIAGAVRWLVAPADAGALAVIFVSSVIVALYTLWTARSYGRGPRA